MNLPTWHYVLGIVCSIVAAAMFTYLVLSGGEPRHKGMSLAEKIRLVQILEGRAP
jgi:hypothetical protein